jgi:hypothetical protein
MTIQGYANRYTEKMNLAYWVSDSNIANNPIILQQLESLPDIYSTQKIYMIIVLGRISLKLNDQEERVYSTGSVIDISSRTKMNITNLSADKMAVLVLKA